MYEDIFNYIKQQYYNNSLYGLNSIYGCYLSEDFRNYIELWESWYHGYNQDFHRYYYYNGYSRIAQDMKCLNMAKKVCEDKASLLLNEKVSINLDNDNDSDTLMEVFKDNEFYVRANELIELSNAMGTGAFVEFIEDDKINIDYITARNIIPITVINGEIINCAFVSVVRFKDDLTYYLNTHIKLEPLEPDNKEGIRKRQEQGIPANYEGYIIENRILKHEQRGLTDKSQFADMDDFVLTDTDIPFFQIIKPNIANNVCVTERSNGMGISAFANAISVLESVDTCYDNLDNEVRAGRKRLIVHDNLAQISIKTSGDNLFKPMFDQNDTTFFAANLEDSSGNLKDPIRAIDSALRINELEKALDTQLRTLSMRCGLGNNFYKFSGGQVKTATEIISDNNPLYKNVKKDEILLEKVLINLTKVILYLSNLNIDQEISINFDDSIFEDTNQTRQNKLLEYNSGLIDKVQYFVDVYKMTADQAMKMVQDMEERMIEEEDSDDLVTG